MCKSWCELILALIIGVLAAWQAISGQLVMWASWTIVVLAVGMIIHSCTCKTCFVGNKPMKK